MLTYLTIASTTPAQIMAYAGQLYTDLSLVIYLAIGLPLGFWVINKVVSLVRAR